MKVLVIKRDKLGDLLLATPMLAHLRSSLPGAELHLLANDYNSWAVDGNPDIDRRWVYRRVRTSSTQRLCQCQGELPTHQGRLLLGAGQVALAAISPINA